MLTCGDTFLFRSSSSNAPPHLYIILTNPTGSPPLAVCVSVTSRRPTSPDCTVVLAAGAHPFIDRESVVFFRDAKSFDVGRVEAWFASCPPGVVCVPKPACDPAVLARIQEGLIRSPFTQKLIKRRCKAEWGVQ